jgi:cytochrome c oxidase subunit 1
VNVAVLPRRPRVKLVTAAASTDHKVIAIRLTLYSAVFFVLSGVMALVLRTELARPGMQIVSHDGYNQLFTMHGSGMFYLVMTPLALAIGVYLVPLQVGAKAIAWPRVALTGDVLQLAGGLVMFSGFFTTHGAAKDGWTAFYPLSSEQHSPGSGMDLWILGVFLVALAQMLLAACILWTALKRRAPGMTLLRMPVLTWAQVVTTLMVLTAYPALLLAMALLFADRHLGPVFDTPGGPGAYQQLFWFYGHPVVYVTFFPFVAAALEVLAVFGSRKVFGYDGVVISLLMFAGLSMSVWAHHMFTTGQVTNQYFSLTSTALIVPAGLEYFALVGTMFGARIRFTTAYLFAVGFVLLFLIGGLSGIIVASPPLDYHVHDSFFVVAHFHYTLFAGSLFAFFAGLYYWWPKVTGRMLGDGLGKLHFALLFAGTNLTFAPMFVLGYDGMPRRVADYSPHAGFTGWNEVSTLGSYVIGIAMLVFAWNVWSSWRRAEPAGDDPWGGHTLEWWTSSPPPRLNFERPLPPIRSFAPLYDLRREQA